MQLGQHWRHTGGGVQDFGDVGGLYVHGGVEDLPYREEKCTEAEEYDKRSNRPKEHHKAAKFLVTNINN